MDEMEGVRETGVAQDGEAQNAKSSAERETARQT
jgi:hypothetical protein